MYNYHNWLELHAKALSQKPIADILVFGPRIYFGQPPTAEQLKELPEFDRDPLAITERVAMAFIGLRMLPAKVFSIYIPEPT
jgi:hypothetical protein